MYKEGHNKIPFVLGRLSDYALGFLSFGKATIEFSSNRLLCALFSNN